MLLVILCGGGSLESFVTIAPWQVQSSGKLSIDGLRSDR